jgi:hypothetical protein
VQPDAHGIRIRDDEIAERVIFLQQVLFDLDAVVGRQLRGIWPHRISRVSDRSARRQNDQAGKEDDARGVHDEESVRSLV